MTSIFAVTLVLFSITTFAQARGQGKAVNEVLPKSMQAHDAIMGSKKTGEAPCADTKKEDILKKLEEEKKAKAAMGKGLSLQGAKDTGCSVK